MHKQSEKDRRDQNHQVYLAEMADKEALEFRRKIGANAQFHHDQELKQLEHQRDVNEANNRQHDHDYNHDKGKKHFTEQVSVNISLRLRQSVKFINTFFGSLKLYSIFYEIFYCDLSFPIH